MQCILLTIVVMEVDGLDVVTFRGVGVPSR